MPTTAPPQATSSTPDDSAPDVTLEVTPSDLLQIQGNVVRGYRMPNARHFALRIVNGGGARRFIGGLADEDGPADQPHVTTARPWHPETKPRYCLNVGFTWVGLRAMGLPESMLSLFPETFQRGPSGNAEKIGDTGESAPEHWEMGGPANPQVHVVLSLFTNEARDPQMEHWTTVLEQEFRKNGLDVVWRRDAAAMRDENGKPNGKVHFGYQDGIAQPRIAGVPGPQREDMQPASQPGEFLLGRRYINQFGGNFAGSLPPQLADNATYGAFRVLQQDVVAFDTFLRTTGERYHMTPELVAAKLMGRWRNGVPLTLSPNTDQPARHPIPANELNNFDFAPSEEHPTFYDDAVGLRCPVGAHIRRLNPRGALVAGMPHSRRIIRRGMPYGPAYIPGVAEQDPPERGLIGFFICGDLGLQFEFLQSTWVNTDLSAAGLRGTREPILGAHPEAGGRFVLRTDDSRDPIVFDNVPRWVRTRGSAYCFIPAIGGLRFLAGF